MSKEIAQKIRAGYGDMRKSEQKAADFILEHLDTSRSAGSVRIPQDRKEDRTPIWSSATWKRWELTTYIRC